MRAVCVISFDGASFDVVFARPLSVAELEALAAAAVRACVERGADPEGVLHRISTSKVTDVAQVPPPVVIRGRAG